jgi:N-methylhydantoinase B
MDVTQDPAAREPADPVTLSVLLHRLEGVVGEMVQTIEHTALSPLLSLCRDFSCALYDADCRQVCMGAGLPIHTASLNLVLQAINRAFAGDIRDGDLFLCNDPQHGNTHIADLVAACPVFIEDRHAFWSVARGHQLDTGAADPSSITPTAENRWQEGMAIPPLRLGRDDAIRPDLLELYLANVRYREVLHGDLLAMIGSIHTGRLRLREIAAEMSLAELQRYADEVIGYADRRMAAEIASMPDGTFHGVAWLDGNGLGDEDVPVRASVTISGDRVHVDYQGSSPQIRGGVNSGIGTAIAAGTCPVLYCVPADIPHNEGCLRHVTVHAPAGTICNADFPASTSCATVAPGDVMQEAVNKALALAVPDRVLAGSSRAGNIPQFTGIDERTGRDWSVMIFNNAGGGGASAAVDGWPMFDSLSTSGGMRCAPIEQTELLFPVLFEWCEIEPGSMGFGQRLGGPGTRCSIRPVAGTMECILFGDGSRNPPHGVAGGTPAAGCISYVENQDGTGRRDYPACAHMWVGHDERWMGISTGGGGYGDPLLRLPDLVADDVRNELYNRATATGIFGVVLAGDGLTLAADEAATAAHREALGAARGAVPAVSPDRPAAGRWAGATDGGRAYRD